MSFQMNDALAAKLAAAMMQLVHTEGGAAVAEAPAPVAVPAAIPDKPARAGRKPTTTAPIAAPTPVSKPVPAAKPELVAKPALAPAGMAFKVEAWIGSDGQKMATLLANGRRKGVSFASEAAFDAYVDGIVAQAVALKATFRAAFNG